MIKHWEFLGGRGWLKGSAFDRATARNYVKLIVPALFVHCATWDVFVARRPWSSSNVSLLDLERCISSFLLLTLQRVLQQLCQIYSSESRVSVVKSCPTTFLITSLTLLTPVASFNCRNAFRSVVYGGQGWWNWVLESLQLYQLSGPLTSLFDCNSKW